jgi:hypothetical protein
MITLGEARGRGMTGPRAGGAVLASRERVGWLLRVHRLLTATGRDRTLAGLASSLSDCTAAPGRISASTVSRWESGRIAATGTVLRGYEEVLDLPVNSLVVPVSTVRRFWSPRLAPGSDPFYGHIGGGDETLDSLLDRVVTDDELTSSEWDVLTASLATRPDIYLRPTEWTGLADRLLRELLIADRGNYMHRREAFQRLLVHPRAQTAAIAATVSAGDDSTGQVFIEAISSLDGSAHPDASRAVLRQLEHPTNAAAQVGALQAAVRKLRYGHFDPEQRLRIWKTADTIHRSAGAASELAALVAQLATTRGEINSELILGGRDARQQAIASRLAVLAVAKTSASEAFGDPVLPSLVSELLFSPSADVRLVASSLLAASPYRAALAQGVALELAAANVITDQPDWADSLLDTLRLIGDSGQLPLVQRLAIADGVPASIARSAAVSLAHVGGQIHRDYWVRVVGRYATLWRRHHRPRHADQLNGLIYSAGTLGELQLLAALKDDTTLPAQCRTAATWWLNLPTHITHGARS